MWSVCSNICIGFSFSAHSPHVNSITCAAFSALLVFFSARWIVMRARKIFGCFFLRSDDCMTRWLQIQMPIDRWEINRCQSHRFACDEICFGNVCIGRARRKLGHTSCKFRRFFASAVAYPNVFDIFPLGSGFLILDKLNGMSNWDFSVFATSIIGMRPNVGAICVAVKNQISVFDTQMR